jgi:hypothetical protein
MSYMDFFAAMRAHADAAPRTLSCTVGELTAYDATRHLGKFTLPLFPDKGGNPIETGWVQIGTPQNGPGYGAQFVPPQNGQAVLFFIDMHNILPLGAIFLFNDVETPPFTDGKTNGWKDKNGSSHTTTDDGPTPGDGKGGAHVQGAAYTTHGTSGGHNIIQDDINKVVKHLSAGGHVILMDDANKLLKHLSAGGHYTLYDDVGRAISHVTAGGLKTLASDATSEISHIAPNVGLGDIVANLDSTHAALNKSHLTQFENDLKSKRLDDLTKFATAMVAAGVPNAGAVLAQLASLVDVPIPSGSSVVKIK